MACTKSSKITRWKALITKYDAELLIIDASILKGMTEIDSYKLDTNEGSQQVKYKEIKKLQKAQDYLERKIEYYQNKICGQGLTRITMRRR